MCKQNHPCLAKNAEFCPWRFSFSQFGAAAAVAKLLQLCPTLCDPIDGSSPGSRIPGILQVRTLEWVAISFSNVWKWKVKVKLLSRVWLLETPWTAAYQASLSMGFSRQEYWSGVPLPSPIREWREVKIILVAKVIIGYFNGYFFWTLKYLWKL